MKEIKIGNESHSPNPLSTITLEQALEQTTQDNFNKAFIMVVIRRGSEPSSRIDWIAQSVCNHNNSFIMIEESFNCHAFHEASCSRTIQQEITYLVESYPWSEFYLVENWTDMQKVLNERLGR